MDPGLFSLGTRNSEQLSQITRRQGVWGYFGDNILGDVLGYFRPDEKVSSYICCRSHPIKKPQTIPFTLPPSLSCTVR